MSAKKDLEKTEFFSLIWIHDHINLSFLKSLFKLFLNKSHNSSVHLLHKNLLKASGNFASLKHYPVQFFSQTIQKLLSGRVHFEHSISRGPDVIRINTVPAIALEQSSNVSDFRHRGESRQD